MEADKAAMTQEHIGEIAEFISRYLSYMLGAGVHTSRVVRNSKRIGAALGTDVSIHTSQKTAMVTVRGRDVHFMDTRVVDIPAFPISFEWNADLSALQHPWACVLPRESTLLRSVGDRCVWGLWR